MEGNHILIYTRMMNIDKRNNVHEPFEFRHNIVIVLLCQSNGDWYLYDTGMNNLVIFVIIYQMNFGTLYS